MRFVLVILAIFSSKQMPQSIATGTLDAQQVAGIGLIFLGLAVVAPAGWPA